VSPLPYSVPLSPHVISESDYAASDRPSQMQGAPPAYCYTSRGVSFFQTISFVKHSVRPNDSNLDPQ